MRQRWVRLLGSWFLFWQFGGRIASHVILFLRRAHIDVVSLLEHERGGEGLDGEQRGGLGVDVVRDVERWRRKT